MLMPPSLVRVVIVRGGRKVVGLWLPVILLWPLVAALAALAIAMSIPVSIITWHTGYGRTILWSVPCMLKLFAATRGLRLDVTETLGLSSSMPTDRPSE